MTSTSSTIAAIATAQGVGAVACIRVSGIDAYRICDNIFRAKNGKLLAAQVVQYACFGEIVDGDNVIDDVLATCFRMPHSYTGENTVEFTCHGSVYIQQHILVLLLRHGAQLAKAGEFTQRAFLNGKMDLSQAEAVADLISSTSAATHRLAMNQMKGNFSNELKKLRAALLDFTSLIELELDFGEEDVEFANRTQLKGLAQHIAEVIQHLADSFKAGNAIKNGIPVAIVGETNVGKSTLLNFLLNEERAIVSDIHGTTRDAIEDTTSVDGIMFRFIDTAGIRETRNKIENIGIERTFQKIKQASIVLWTIDALGKIDDIKRLAEQLQAYIDGKKLIAVLNKVDLLDIHERQSKETMLRQIAPYAEHLSISASRQLHTDNLLQLLVKAASLPEVNENDVIVTNLRHYQALIKAYGALVRVIEGLDNNVSGDFLSQDIRECLHHLGEITGEINTDEILGNIFSKFCIGK